MSRPTPTGVTAIRTDVEDSGTVCNPIDCFSYAWLRQLVLGEIKFNRGPDAKCHIGLMGHVVMKHSQLGEAATVTSTGA